MTTKPTQVRHVPMETFLVFPVAADELTVLENGTSSPLFGVASLLVGIAFSFLANTISLWPTGNDPLSAKFVGCLVVAAATVVGGGLLGYFWRKESNVVRTLLKKIRDRDRVPAGTAAPAPAVTRPAGAGA